MPDPTPPESSLPIDLHAIAVKLREAEHLDREGREALADLVDEMGRSLDANKVPSAEMAHLLDSIDHLVHALYHRHEEGIVHAARERLDHAALAAENKAPFAVGLAKRFIDALANVGI